MGETHADDRTTIEVPGRFALDLKRFVELLEQSPSYSKVISKAIADATISLPDRPDYPLWDDDDVVALANAGSRTAANYREIMDAIIREGRDGEWVSISQLSEWTGLNPAELKAFRTHLYRHIHAHYAGKYSNAPFTGAWGTDLRPSRGRVVYYRVSRECAYQWERIQESLG